MTYQTCRNQRKIVTFNRGYAMMKQKFGRKINATMMRDGRIAYIIII